MAKLMNASMGSAAAAAAVGLGMPSMPPGMDLQMLASYRTMRGVMPIEQIDRVYGQEMRERFDMLLKMAQVGGRHVTSVM